MNLLNRAFKMFLALACKLVAQKQDIWLVWDSKVIYDFASFLFLMIILFKNNDFQISGPYKGFIFASVITKNSSKVNVKGKMRSMVVQIMIWFWTVWRNMYN